MKDLFSPSHSQQQQQQHTASVACGYSDADVSMDDDGHSVNTASNNLNSTSVNTSNECMSIASPPRTVMRTINRRPLIATATGSASVRSGRIRSRLFEEDEEEEDEDDQNIHPPTLHRKPPALKTMSLNLDFAAEAASEDGDAEHNRDPRTGAAVARHRTHNMPTSAAAAPLDKTPRRLPGGLRKRSAEQYDLYTKQSMSFDGEDGEEDVFSAAESPVDMYASPRISPSSPPSSGSRSANGNQSRISMYRSPSIPRPRAASVGQSSLAAHKSPSSFLTLDGRTVQSKNPFSPMIFDEHLTPGSMMDTSLHISSARAKMELRSSPSSPTNGNEALFLNMNERSLSLPSSLSARAEGNTSSASSGEAGRMLLPRHTLHKRDGYNSLDHGALSMEGLAPVNPSEQQHHTLQRHQEQMQKESYYTRDGYPERTGRYSFTGSPIREHLEVPPRPEKAHAAAAGLPSDVCTNVHKIRRRTKGDDVVAAAAHGDPSCKRRGMYIETNSSKDNNMYPGQQSPEDNISPTDVANFPLFRSASSDTKTLPPTPSKPVRRPPSKKYTPIRKSTGPPPTPMPAIRRARSFDDDDFGDAPDRVGPRRHSSGSTMDYLSLSPGGEGGQMLVPASGPPPSRFYSDFDIISELGNGSFGNVYKVLSRLDGCMYAIKVAHRPAKGMADKDRMLKEVYALAALSDQADTATFHIVRYHQAWMEEHRLYIQTELCTTTLQAEMQQASPVALPLARRYKCLREILLALEYIHKNGMVHLDIKPENVFVSTSIDDVEVSLSRIVSHGVSNRHLPILQLKNDQFKLGDFGLVSKISSQDVEEGDSRYMSLELLSGDHADLTKSDIFSLGITMYELCLGGNKALPSNGPEWQSLRSGAIPSLPDTPVELHKIILTMMHPSYQERPCASELLKRPQLLSDEQKMLMLERSKVLQANLALVAQSKRLEQLAPVPAMPKKGMLTRRNTWSFS